jgi:drug/metabolite transporter (DMT)-like permease
MWAENTAANRRIGIALLSAGTLSFSLLDSTVKWLLHSLPFMELVWMRFASQVVISGAMLLPQEGAALFHLRNWRLQLLRALILGTMTMFNFWSIQYLQLTETASILFSSPLIVAAISHFWLKETLGRRQWLAIAAGFIGILIVVRPSSNVVHPAIFLMVLNAFMFALFGLITRHLSRTEHPGAMQLYSALGATLMFTPWAFSEFVWPSGLWHWVLLLSTGLWGSVGHYLWARAHQYAPSAVLAPFGYQQLLYMALWGWLLFGDVPPAAVFLGGGIIVASGLYLLWDQAHSDAKT